MSKFITYEYESGEIVFIDRNAISSFRPMYTHPGKYRILVTVGKESFVIKDCLTIEEAKNWINEQIAYIELDGYPVKEVVKEKKNG